MNQENSTPLAEITPPTPAPGVAPPENAAARVALAAQSFVDYGQYPRKMLIGTKTILSFINSYLMESPLHYVTFVRNYRPRLRQAGIIRRDTMTRRDVAVPYLLAKFWEEEILSHPPKEA